MANKSKFNSKYHQGVFVPKNANKYSGLTPVKFRSSWEFHFMKYLDEHDDVVSWTSETIVIPYQDLDGKFHRYYTDFSYSLKDPNDPTKLERVLVEIKPKKELEVPSKPVNETSKALENYEYSIRTYIKNRLKWNAALDYCNKRNMKFVIITEEHLKKYGIM